MGNPPREGPTKTAKCTGAGPRGQSGWQPEVPVLLGKTPKFEGWSEGLSDVEAFPAAAFALGLGILEFEGLVETLLDEVHQRPVDQGQA